MYLEKIKSSKFENNNLLKFIILTSMIIVNWFIIYSSGGTTFVYTHTMYVPILIAAFFLGVKGSIIVAIVASIVLGPFMPQNVEFHIQQEVPNYIIRSIFFITIGTMSGLFMDSYKKNIIKIKKFTCNNSITGLPNGNELEYEIESTLKNKKNDSFILMALSLNCLSDIYNFIGYDYGNEFLLKVKERLQTALNHEYIYHLENDKFVILVKSVEIKEGVYNAIELIKFLNNSYKINGIHVSPDVNIGIVDYPEHGNTIDELLQNANIALYNAEKHGVKLRVYDHNRDHIYFENINMLVMLDKAIKENELNLYYQPKMDINNDEIQGVEALLRWKSKTEGFIPPDKFIPMAEKTGLIHEITKWVLKEAISKISEWKKEGKDICVAVNLSSKDFKNREFIDYTKSLLEHYSVLPDMLEFEITETAILENCEAVKKFLDEVKDLGIRIALDDFGTGYNSLKHLEELPIDYIKIDQSFVQNMDKSKSNKIVKTTIKLAHELGMKVVAEGVETKEILDLLIDMNCDVIQGYYYSKPVPDIESVKITA